MIYPGVQAGDRRVIGSLTAAAELAQTCALRASARGTFCVGGVLLGPGGELLAESSNHVLSQGAVSDPTAHGERQLVDWYLDQPSMPPASECTVVSTLDPCMMCTGALLSVGFRVVTLALDPDAGVNWRGDCSFEALPPALRPLAASRFAYLGVEGVRAPFGCSEFVSRDLERGSYNLFRSSLERVKSVVHGRFSPELEEIDWGAEPAAVLSRGRVVGVGTVVELCRRFPLRDLTLVQRRGPDLSAASIMELGAYGSCVEGPVRGGWHYVEPGCAPEELEAQLSRMPPFYREVVGIRVEQL